MAEYAEEGENRIYWSGKLLTKEEFKQLGLITGLIVTTWHATWAERIESINAQCFFCNEQWPLAFYQEPQRVGDSPIMAAFYLHDSPWQDIYPGLYPCRAGDLWFRWKTKLDQEPR